MALGYVPKHLITEELCKIAVKQNCLALGHVPYTLKEKMKQYIKPVVMPEEKYKIVFEQLRSHFPKNFWLSKM